MKITSIRATSRASIKVRDSFYTMEYCEERSIDPEFYETVIIRVTRALPYHAIGFYGE